MYLRYTIDEKRVYVLPDKLHKKVLILDNPEVTRELREDGNGIYFLYKSYKIYLKNGNPYSMLNVRDTIRKNGAGSVSVEDLGKSILMDDPQEIRFIYNIPVRYLDIKIKNMPIQRLVDGRTRIPTICVGIQTSDRAGTGVPFSMSFKPESIHVLIDQRDLVIYSNSMAIQIADGSMELILTDREYEEAKARIRSWFNTNIKPSIFKQLAIAVTPNLNKTVSRKINRRDYYEYDT